VIIQALVKRYEDMGGGMPGWQQRFADYGVNIDAEGNVLGITPLYQQDGNKKVRRVFLLPEEPLGRSGGIKPAFLCDNGGYVFGLDPKRGKAKFEASAALHHNVLRNTKTLASEAIKAFFMKQRPPADIAETGTYVFMVEGRFAHEDKEICKAWNNYRSSRMKGEIIRCLVTGELDSLTALHGKIRLPGVSTGAVPLISINAESFASYGKTANDPAAQIGEKASYAYVTALNDLLNDSTHRKRIAQDTLVYWAEGNDTAEAETFSWFVEPQESDTSKLDAIMKAISAGDKVNADGCDMDKRFYLLCMSPNAGRISVRFFYADSFGSILSHNAAHYKNLEITGKNRLPYIPPWAILRETTVKKTASDAAPLLGGQLLDAMITGRNYPMTLYNAIMARVRAGEEINQIKAAVIKAVLIKNYNSEVATVALKKDSMNIPYTLGRLFYLLEYLQEQANGSATIRQRYFSSACSNPRNVFPTLLSLSMHHADKIENATWFEKQKGELLSRLDADNPFPPTLNLQQQGEFIIGYYHQQQDRFTKKEEK
jgi:CRISPR-associated protein Csd1